MGVGQADPEVIQDGSQTTIYVISFYVFLALSERNFAMTFLFAMGFFSLGLSTLSRCSTLRKRIFGVPLMSFISLNVQVNSIQICRLSRPNATS